jgi:hypothetical protein
MPRRPRKATKAKATKATKKRAAPVLTNIGKFEGRDVLATSIKVTHAGDGLSSALGVEPRVMQSGEIRYVLLKCEVGPIRHVPIADAGAFTREHTLIAQDASILADAEAEEWAASVIGYQTDQAQRTRDSVTGQRSIADELDPAGEPASAPGPGQVIVNGQVVDLADVSRGTVVDEDGNTVDPGDDNDLEL